MARVLEILDIKYNLFVLYENYFFLFIISLISRISFLFPFNKPFHLKDKIARFLIIDVELLS